MTYSPAPRPPLTPPVLLISPHPTRPPVIIYVGNSSTFNMIFKDLIERLSPHTHLYSARGPVDVADLLKMHGSTVVGILTDGHLKGGTAYDIVRMSDVTLGRNVPFLVVSASPESFPPNAFSRPPVAIRSNGDNLMHVVLELLNAITAPMSR